MSHDVRKEIVKWKEEHDLSYEAIYKALNFRSRKTCQHFMTSKRFNRYQDLLERFAILKENVAGRESGAE